MITFNAYHKDCWLLDHAPNYIVPCLPFMTVLDLLVGAAHQQFPSVKVIAIEELQIYDFFDVSQDLSLRFEIKPLADDAIEVRLHNISASRKRLAASGRLQLAEHFPQAPKCSVPSVQGETFDPYQEGLFHGPVFQGVHSMVMGQGESLACANADFVSAPFGAMNQVLLDCLLHGIPSNDLHLWTDAIDSSVLGLPMRCLSMRVFAEAPRQGEVTFHTKLHGFYKESAKFPIFKVMAWHQERLWCEFELVESLFQKSRLGSDVAKRYRFLVEQEYVDGVHLCDYQNGSTQLDKSFAKRVDWLPGSLKKLYHCQANELDRVMVEVAMKEHVAKQLHVHPSLLDVLGDATVRYRQQPWIIQTVHVDDLGKVIQVSNADSRAHQSA